jgi:hypothetical protein
VNLIVHRQEYRPARYGGKYHVRTINGVAACRGTIEVLDTRDFLLAGEKPHPIICRRCLAQESEK